MSIPNLYVGIGGDAGNGATKLGKSDVTEEWSIGDKQVYELAEILKPYADRVLYIIEGNHWAGRRKHDVYFTPEHTEKVTKEIAVKFHWFFFVNLHFHWRRFESKNLFYSNCDITQFSKFDLIKEFLKLRYCNFMTDCCIPPHSAADNKTTFHSFNLYHTYIHLKMRFIF